MTTSAQTHRHRISRVEPLAKYFLLDLFQNFAPSKIRYSSSSSATPQEQTCFNLDGRRIGLLGVYVVYLKLKYVRVLAGFAAGAASVALMCRVVGSIYISATSIGSRLLNLFREEAGLCLDLLEKYVSTMAITAILG